MVALGLDLTNPLVVLIKCWKACSHQGKITLAFGLDPSNSPVVLNDGWSSIFSVNGKIVGLWAWFVEFTRGLNEGMSNVFSIEGKIVTIFGLDSMDSNWSFSVVRLTELWESSWRVLMFAKFLQVFVSPSSSSPPPLINKNEPSIYKKKEVMCQSSYLNLISQL